MWIWCIHNLNGYIIFCKNALLYCGFIIYISWHVCAKNKIRHGHYIFTSLQSSVTVLHIFLYISQNYGAYGANVYNFVKLNYVFQSRVLILPFHMIQISGSTGTHVTSRPNRARGRDRVTSSLRSLFFLVPSRPWV